MGDILIIEDEPTLADDMCQYLVLAGHDAAYVSTGSDAMARVLVQPPDLIILDHQLPDMTGLEIMRHVRERGSRAAVIMVTAHADVPIAVAALKDGAADFLTKPVALEELGAAVDTALRRRHVEQRLAYFRNAEQARGTIIGTSSAMGVVHKMIQRVTASPALASAVPPTVLITGETGTGKDLAAQTIHYNGPRSAAQFVRVNCTALPDQLVESELFGHVRGAFTDAHTDKRGLFEIAEGGTVFLDEIGHMKLPLQAKLLSVLERRRYRQLGATREREANIHVIAATNRDLEDAVRRGEFRRDLYHRIRTLAIHLPSLRERIGDIAPLAEYFLMLHATRFGVAADQFSEAALSKLENYSWPGNVRELSHTIESAVLLAENGLVECDALRCGRGADPGGPVGHKVMTVDFAAEHPTLEDIQHHVIEHALSLTDRNYTRAAQLLGISRDAIRYRLDKRQGTSDA